MKKINDIYLTEEDLLGLESKLIGQGTDGCVFRLNKKYLIKLYHNAIREIKNKNFILSAKTKIYDRNAVHSMRRDNQIHYYAYEGDNVRIPPKEAIYKAIERQKYITRTKLPQAAVYLDGKFAGALLESSKGIQIHKLTGCRKSTKRKIFLDALISVRELLTHNIYHIDLANSPYAKVSTINDNLSDHYGHSHILCNLFTKNNNIIDLDGKSTLYTEYYSPDFKRETEISLCMLLKEFFYELDAEYSEDDTVTLDLISDHLERAGVPSIYIDKLIDNLLTIDEIEACVKTK